MTSLPPGIILIIGALLLPLFKGPLRAALLVLLPLASAAHLLALPSELTWSCTAFDYTLTPVRIDALSRIWGIVFHIAALLSAIYALHVKDPIQHVAGLLYAGAAIGAVFAGDLITLFVYWELTALASVFLVWASRTERAYRSGIRYLVIQVGSGVLLLSGILLHLAAGGSLAFTSFTDVGLRAPGVLLIFLAFGIKAAFPLLHNWLIDAYPEATPSGAVFLSAFTTKLAIYALARGFAGTEVLIVIGGAMAVFPVFYAIIENDLRRVLAYGLNNQLGYMVVGIGIGSELALNGAAAHAFAHILYKGLLFMAMGAVLFRTGTARATDLGGLWRAMPWTTLFCLIGAASIAAVPLFSGFVTKSMILTAAAEEHHTVAWAVLIFATAGVLLAVDLKVPYFAFFARKDEPAAGEIREAPWNMLLAMATASALCIGIGVVPQYLYQLLPFPVSYHAYTTDHVLAQCQFLVFAVIAFAFLLRFHLFPRNVPGVNLDSDWLYRRVGRNLVQGSLAAAVWSRQAINQTATRACSGCTRVLHDALGPRSVFSRSWSTSAMVLWCTVLLTLYLVLYYLH